MRTGKSISCLFVSDLHGQEDRFDTLFRRIQIERPQIVMLGGDLLPPWMVRSEDPRHSFLSNLLRMPLRRLRSELNQDYPRVLVILGNDDAREVEQELREGEAEGVWEYVHDRTVTVGGYSFTGYNYVPPTPFLLKDWERYDVSRYVDPGCVSPEEGRRTVPVSEHELRFSTIADDLQRLGKGLDYRSAVFLFHSPPYKTSLDRADLGGRSIDHAPLDVNVGSIAIRRFLEEHQPLLSLHGHIHESARLTGAWTDRIGRTTCLSAAHEGPELALVRVQLQDPLVAERELV